MKSVTRFTMVAASNATPHKTADARLVCQLRPTCLFERRSGEFGSPVSANSAGQALRERLFQSGPIDTAREATRAREMHVEAVDAWVVEQALDQRLEYAAVDHVGIDHQPLRVIGSNGQDPEPKQLWYLVDANERLLRMLANEDRARGAVGRVGVLMDERHEDDVLAWRGVNKAHATRKARLTIRDEALRAFRSQLLIIKCEERCEGFER